MTIGQVARRENLTQQASTLPASPPASNVSRRRETGLRGNPEEKEWGKCELVYLEGVCGSAGTGRQ